MPPSFGQRALQLPKYPLCQTPVGPRTCSALGRGFALWGSTTDEIGKLNPSCDVIVVNNLIIR